MDGEWGVGSRQWTVAPSVAGVDDPGSGLRGQRPQLQLRLFRPLGITEARLIVLTVMVLS